MIAEVILLPTAQTSGSNGRELLYAVCFGLRVGCASRRKSVFPFLYYLREMEGEEEACGRERKGRREGSCAHEQRCSNIQPSYVPYALQRTEGVKCACMLLGQCSVPALHVQNTAR